MKRISIIVCDDHPVVRQGLAKTIEQNKSYEILAQCKDGQDAYDKITELRPDIAIVDISMPEISGLDVVRMINKKKLSTKIIILTMYNEEEYFNEAMDLGVKGYLLKDNAVSALVDCIKEVSNGKNYVCPTLSEYLINRNLKLKKVIKENTVFGRLTVTELNVLQLIAESKTSKQIAKELAISFRTVQNHRHHISEKLGLHGPNRLLQFAIENKSNF